MFLKLLVGFDIYNYNFRIVLSAVGAYLQPGVKRCATSTFKNPLPKLSKIDLTKKTDA